MVIYIDQEAFLQTIQPCALNAVTLQDDSRLVISLHTL